VRVLAFTATWCGPCQRAKPTIAAARKRGINIEEIDIDSRPDLARQYAITSVPTFVIHTGGGENRTHDPNAVAALTP
jgi:thioredoxin 1